MRLEDAVISAVTELKTNGVFSAYDLTTFIRNKANAGEFDLPGLEARLNNQNIKYWINHDDVKSILADLFVSGALENLGLVDRTFNGNYLEYHFDTTNGTTTVTVTTSPNPATLTVTPTSNDLDSKVGSYLVKNLRRGTTTLKDIQSALKINGVLCEDIYASIGRLGFTSTGTDGFYSTYVIG